MKQKRWYLSTWFISLLFALWFLIIPLIVGIVLLIKEIKFEKKNRKQYFENGFDQIENVQHKVESLNKKVEEKRIELDQLNKNKKDLEESIRKSEERLGGLNEGTDLKQKMDHLQDEIDRLEKVISAKKEEIVVLDDEALYQSFGFYEPKYGFESSEKYKHELDSIRQKQKDLVKTKTATNHFEGWTVEGSIKKGQSFNNNNIKLTIRSFNNECDNAIKNVTFSNIEATEKRIKKARETLNRLNNTNRIEIKGDYLALKLDELYLLYEYKQKKEEEKEEQRLLKEQMREEKRVQQEIEQEKKKLKKDETHFAQAYKQLEKQSKDADEEMKKEINAKMVEIEESMKALQEELKAVDYREQNAKAGYVYIVSNIGSFGENIFKIGMTRRLEPTERVKELGGASVPFDFDIHAMVFSEDAPALENALHKEFVDYQVNRINPRKEFFRISMEAIETKVKEKHDKTVEFTRLAHAEDYRKSLQIEKTQEKQGIA